MFKNLPPLPSLRAFEAVARLRSFTAAAEELGITQGAVSQHVKALEEEMGRPLFTRQPRGAALTAEGRRIIGRIREGLDCLAQAFDGRNMDRTLTVSALPGFTVKWLFPRLIKFDQQYPEIEVSISALGRPLEFGVEEADCAIRYGRGNYPGLIVEPLLDDDMFPVCSPRLLRDAPPLRCAADLRGHVLLHDEIKAIDGIQPGWQSWLDQTGAVPPKFGNSRYFGQSNMVIQAAIEGMGVALGRQSLAIDDLQSGLLVRPFGAAVPSGFTYYFVCPRSAIQRPKVEAFRAWLHAEAAMMPALPPPVDSG
jgi:LysR family glycine cleavage system transcriptional activator